MTNRRTLVRAHTHWRPAVAPARAAVDEAPTSGPRGRSRAGAQLAIGIAVFAVGLAGWLGGSQLRGSGATLEATPAAWLDSFTAAVARDPGRVCSELLTPVYRAELERVAHRPCASYWGSVGPLAVRIVRTLKAGSTAALVVRYWPRGGYGTFVLDREARGWRAVAIVPGGTAPPT
jgi:hypothetical protein